MTPILEFLLLVGPLTIAGLVGIIIVALAIDWWLLGKGGQR